MKYQIDQSNKIEETSKVTYVCLANGKTIIFSINSNEKQKLKLFFRELNKPLIFKLFTFSVLCAKAIITSKAGTVEIDCEYTNHEIDIKSYITQILLIEKTRSPDIWFAHVGKKSNAHLKGYAAMKKKAKGVTITAGEVLRYYENIDKP
ncbi:MAG: hypothetical protein NT141_04620 [candidate division WWE3 bacterium]|nr:hypothetical protein [candidate division WWE3 bacterium]